jgi:hypothetical protein
MSARASAFTKGNSRYSFGKDFVYTWFPLENDAELADDQIAVIEGLLDSVYIFATEQRPTRDEAAAGTGATQTINSWTDNGQRGFDIAIDAIEDPEPEAEIYFRDFWIAINYRLEVGGQIQTVRRLLPMARIGGVSEAVEVSDETLIELWPEVVSFTRDGQERCAQVRQANLDMRRDVTTALIQYAEIHNPGELERALAFKALEYIALSKRELAGDKFDLRATQFRKQFDKEMSRLDRLRADSNRDGQPDTNLVQKSQVITLR